MYFLPKGRSYRPCFLHIFLSWVNLFIPNKHSYVCRLYHLASPPSSTPLSTYRPLQCFYHYITILLRVCSIDCPKQCLFLPLLISNTLRFSPTIPIFQAYPYLLLYQSRKPFSSFSMSTSCNVFPSSFLNLYVAAPL